MDCFTRFSTLEDCIIVSSDTSTCPIYNGTLKYMSDLQRYPKVLCQINNEK